MLVATVPDDDLLARLGDLAAAHRDDLRLVRWDLVEPLDPETAAQVEGLRSQGCRAGQGYHFARPLDERDAEVVLAGSLSRS